MNKVFRHLHDHRMDKNLITGREPCIDLLFITTTRFNASSSAQKIFFWYPPLLICTNSLVKTPQEKFCMVDSEMYMKTVLTAANITFNFIQLWSIILWIKIESHTYFMVITVEAYYRESNKFVKYPNIIGRYYPHDTFIVIYSYTLPYHNYKHKNLYYTLLNFSVYKNFCFDLWYTICRE